MTTDTNLAKTKNDIASVQTGRKAFFNITQSLRYNRLWSLQAAKLSRLQSLIKYQAVKPHQAAKPFQAVHPFHWLNTSVQSGRRDLKDFCLIVFPFTLGSAIASAHLLEGTSRRGQTGKGKGIFAIYVVAAGDIFILKLIQIISTFFRSLDDNSTGPAWILASDPSICDITVSLWIWCFLCCARTHIYI